MSETPKFMSREEFEKVIVKKAQEDTDFKKALLGKPHEAIARFGVQVPEEIEIKVVEKSARVLYLVLPLNPDELTDEQLEEVSAAGSHFCLERIIDEFIDGFCPDFLK